MWSKEYRKKVFYLILGAFAVYACLIHADAQVFGDDFFYRTSVQQYPSVLEWAKAFYTTWEGRVPLLFLACVFLNMPFIIWKCVNVFVFILLAVYMYKTGAVLLGRDRKNKDFMLLLFICLGLGTLPYTLIKPSVLWVTGSVNYLFTAAGLLVGTYPLLKEAMGKEKFWYDYVIAIPGLFLAAYEEQTSAVLLVLGFLYGVIIWSTKKRISLASCLLYVWGGVNCMILFVAPGNLVRFTTELVKWYPDYNMLTILDKILMGVLVTFREFFDRGFTILFVIGVLLLVINLYQKRYVSQIVSGILLFLDIMMPEIFRQMPTDIVTDVFDRKNLFYIATIIFWIFLSGICILDTLEWGRQGIITALLFMAGLCSGAVMGFSPTIYASSTRVFFLAYVLFAAVAAILAAAAFETAIKESLMAR